jgi:hypothetical protein
MELSGRAAPRGRLGCRAFRLDFEEGLGGETEERTLLLPVMRQVFAQSQQSGRR